MRWAPVLEAVLDNIVPLIYLFDLVLLVSMLFLERGDPSKTLLWVVILLVIPVFGFVLYLFFGQTFYAKHAFKSVERSRIPPEYVSESCSDVPEGCAGLAEALYRAGAGIVTSDNDVRLFTDGNEKFDSLKEDIRNARRFVHLEYYIIRKDPLGDEIVSLLAQKAAEGVEVRLMVDALGFNTGTSGKRALREAGGKVAVFHSTAVCLLSPKKNNRNHRKIAVIDGRISYIGGFNIGEEYLGKGKFGHWRDTAVRIEGSATNALSFRFSSDWKYACKEDLTADPAYYGMACGIGDTPVQTVMGGPDVGRDNPIAFQYLMMIENAERTLYIHTPYFDPNQACLMALRAAAMRGVDVRVIIPDIGDHPFVYWSNRKYAYEVMRSGVRVYEYHDGFVHSKSVVADGRLCSVGSANFDDRSMSLNFEGNAMIYSEELGAEMDAAFLGDLGRCTEYTIETYESRTLLQRVNTSVSWMFSGQL